MSTDVKTATAASSDEINCLNLNQHHEKRLSNELPCQNEPADEDKEGREAVALEEGEIGDDAEVQSVQKTQKRKRKEKKSRKRHKETVVYDGDLYAYDMDNASPDKKRKSDEPKKPQIQSLLSLNLIRSGDNALMQHSGTESNSDADAAAGTTRIQNEFAAKSLHELISATHTGTQFFDPTITEKENSKPMLKQHQQQQQQQKKQEATMTKKQRREAGIVSKKEQKKMKYLEMMKQREKRADPILAKSTEKAICKFYLEGRCTKGKECPFSHNAPINKKFEICKYYLNGYCAKNENCVFMHAEFPCKFYHANRECKNGSNCKFSHAPITTAEMREVFIKYLKETDESAAANYQATSSPPLRAPNIQPQAAIPSLMAITVPSQKPPSLMFDPKPKQQQELPLFSEQDIDYRSVGDVDLRSTPQQQPPIEGLMKMLGSNQQPELIGRLLPDLVKMAAPTNAFLNMKTPEPVNECVEIDARTDGSLPYRAVLIDIPLSSLWKHPPRGDSESDPRIEFYANKLNMKENKDSHEQKTPNSINLNVFTSSSSVSALSPPQQQQTKKSFEDRSAKTQTKDPRLASKAANEAPSLNDLLSLQNQILNNPQPKQQQQASNSNNRSKLSIDDYKRKTQTTVTSGYYSNEAPPSRYQQQQSVLTPSYAPPSYSVSNLTSLGDLKMPQSLHELLKNLPS